MKQIVAWLILRFYKNYEYDAPWEGKYREWAYLTRGKKVCTIKT